MDGAAICDAALAAVEKSRNSYQTKYDEWFNDVKELTKKRDEAKEAYTRADIALANTPINAQVANIARGYGGGSECSSWSADECDTRCNWRYLTTPGGRKSQWYYTRPRSDKCSQKCICHFVDTWDASDATEKKVKYEQAENNLKNRINEEPKYKDENPPTVQCCSNDLDCNKGICRGIIQQCRFVINERKKKENESTVIDNIRYIKKLLDEFIINFNKNVESFNNNYNNFNNINFNQKNVNIIYNQINSIYDNLTLIFNSIEKDTEYIMIYFNSLFINNQRISANSNFKEESNRILGDASTKTQEATYTYQKIIVELYFAVYDYFNNIVRKKNNYNTMLLKKSLLDTNVNNFNNNIETINNIYSEINAINLTSDIDLEKILELKDKAVNVFNNQVKNYKTSINEKFNEINILRDTISPDPKYLYFNLANNIYIACENMNTLVNKKFIELEEIINKTNNTTNQKKDNYETFKRHNEEKKILYAKEEEDKSFNDDLITMQLLEKENNNENSNNQITQFPINTYTYTSEETVKIDYTIYIIGAIVVVIFITFLFIKK